MWIDAEKTLGPVCNTKTEPMWQMWGTGGQDTEEEAGQADWGQGIGLKSVVQWDWGAGEAFKANWGTWTYFKGTVKNAGKTGTCRRQEF